MRVSRHVLFHISHRISQRAVCGMMLAGLLSAGHVPRVRAQQVNPEVAWPDVALFDIVCRYKNETYTLRGRALQGRLASGLAQFQSGSVNQLSYLFPTGTCTDLCAYFDPYVTRPPRAEGGLRMKTLPPEILSGVPCRVVEMLDPPPPVLVLRQTLPALARVVMRWYIAPDGQTRRMTGTFRLFKPDGKTPDSSLLVMDALYNFHDPGGGAIRAASAVPPRAFDARMDAQGRVSELVASPTQPRLAVAGSDGSVTVWDTAALQPIYSLRNQPGWRQSLSFSHDGSRLASGASGGVQVWDMATGKAVRNLDTKSQRIEALALSPDGRTLVTAGYSQGASEPVRVWDVETGKMVRELEERGAAQVIFAPDGRTLATGTYNAARLWDTTSWKEKLTLHEDEEPSGYAGALPLAFSPDGKLLAAGDTRTWGLSIGLVSDLGTGENAPTVTRIWDTQTGRLLHSLSGTTGPVRSLAFAPDGRTLAVVDTDTSEEGAGRNSAVLLWDTQTWKQIGPLAVEHGKTIDRIAWTADGKTLATTYNDAAVKLWAVPAR